MNILVTGVGAVIGYGIIRSLKKSQYPARIIGMDIYEDAVGRYWCDSFEKAVPVSDPGYLDFLKMVIEKHHVDLVIPGIIQDQARLSKARGFFGGPAHFALNDPELVEIADDKWAMAGRLHGTAIKTIPSAIDGKFEELSAQWGKPLFLKPRRSYASKGILEIGNAAEFEFWKKKLAENFMVQKIVGPGALEYTVGAFGLGNGRTAGMIIFERKLNAEGSTEKVKVRAVPGIELAVRQLSEIFKPVGPTNFQFLLHEGEYLLLEINPRMSSATSLRTAFGYNEAEMCVAFFLEGKTPEAPSIRSGSAARFFEDHVIYDSHSL